MNANAEQKEAICHRQGPMMVLAGPGSGKTYVLTRRVKYLIEKENVSPSSILVVTFTKAAAGQMRERFLSMVKEKSTRVSFGTFHSVFFTILKAAYGFNGQNILTEEEKRKILKGYIYGHGLEIEDEGDFLEQVIKEISKVKNSKIDLEHFYATSCSASVFRVIYEGYQRECKKLKKLDFDDMLLYCYDLLLQRKDILKLWQDKFAYIMIDEFQDINQIQYEIVKMLAGDRENLFIVGDDDQAIYHFRGSKPEIMLHFPKDFPKTKVVSLTTNYRCSGNIVEASKKLIKNNKHRYKKDLKAHKEMGTNIAYQTFEDEREESLYFLKEIQDYIKAGGILEEIACLFRTNHGARNLVERLVEYNIPFQMKDRLPNLYEHWIAKDFMVYLEMAQGSRKRSDFLRVMNRPNRYIARDLIRENPMSFDSLYRDFEDKRWMVERIEEWESDLRWIKTLPPYAAINYIRKAIGYNDFLEEYAGFRQIKVEELYSLADELQESAKGFASLEKWKEHIANYTKSLQEQFLEKQKNPQGIVISTLHSIKGLEYNRVYLYDVNEKIIPYHKAVLESDLEEERRLFYVGMTRAREKLYIWNTKKRFDKKQEPSLFLEELFKNTK
ncbi:MAG TPA: ATP-dependent helicase [Lachnospiraceae bacterium]